MPNTEPGEKLDEEHADTARSYDRNLGPGQDRLADRAEQERLAVVPRCNPCVCLRGLRGQHGAALADDHQPHELGPPPVQQPDVAGGGLGGQDKSAHVLAREPEERGVAALVRCQVRPGECDRVVPAVVVGGEVHELLLAGAPRLVRDELAGEVPVAAGARDVVDPILGEHDLAHEKTSASWAVGHSAEEDRAMLIVVAREEVVVQTGPVALRDVQFDGR